MTKIRVVLGVVLVVFVFAVAVNAGAFRGDGDGDRKCGNDANGREIRPRAVAAQASWLPKVGQQRSYVQIHGFIAKTNIEEPNVSVAPQRFHGVACPGETASITVEAHAGPLPSIQAHIEVGGTKLTGGAVTYSGVPGYRAQATAVIP